MIAILSWFCNSSRDDYHHAFAGLCWPWRSPCYFLLVDHPLDPNYKTLVYHHLFAITMAAITWLTMMIYFLLVDHPYDHSISCQHCCKKWIIMIIHYAHPLLPSLLTIGWSTAVAVVVALGLWSQLCGRSPGGVSFRGLVGRGLAAGWLGGWLVAWLQGDSGDVQLVKHSSD